MTRLKKRCCLLGLFVPSLLRAGDADVVATVGGRSITESQMMAAVGNRLCEAETAEYREKLQVLNDIVDKSLEEEEAHRRGLTLERLLDAEVLQKTAPVPAGELAEAYEKVKGRFPGKPEAEVKAALSDDMKRRRERARRLEFRQELRRKSDAKVLMEPPRVAVDSSAGPERGGKDAPVTILEFSDFQCPYCGGVEPVMKRLGDSYGDRIRIVFREYPLPAHPQASKAAEAALCALDQGKFWEMHDHLFAHQDKLQVSDLKAASVEVGLDPAAFSECLDSGRHEADWRADQKIGDQYGVQATPWFFINGRCLGGAQPYEAFAQVVDDELSRRAPRAAPGK